ncbi:hypothetical protein CVT26_011014 [Gymnopilus dilepis]|uniref:Pyridoxamine 5'-phosphate oxidase N-terminal domain-containing protein n=1 Tax=Gymnopilus dilepis TaxID=231916 RepID=A0A409VY91_9AGAR|nr:hypothetical protein CVT26_011014 [Gymnopilus dilepis]
MGQYFDEIPEHLVSWILDQQMFWVASAPLSPQGHVNLSPKSIEGTFHIVNRRRVWYEDLSGSGAETVAHIRENGRVTILFHAFEGPARIVRLYGKGFFYELGSPEYEALVNSESRLPGSRAVVGLDITKVGTTCGYTVPYYQFISHRRQLIDWAEKKETVDQDDVASPPISPVETNDVPSDAVNDINPKGMRHWWQSHNVYSIDGLPALSKNFGLAFPYVFSFGRLRAQKAAKAAGTQKGFGRRRKALVSTVHGEVITAVQTDTNDLAQYSTLASVVMFFLIFLVGLQSGRVFEQYRHSHVIPSLGN